MDDEERGPYYLVWTCRLAALQHWFFSRRLVFRRPTTGRPVLRVKQLDRSGPDSPTVCSIAVRLKAVARRQPNVVADRSRVNPLDVCLRVS